MNTVGAVGINNAKETLAEIQNKLNGRVVKTHEACTGQKVKRVYFTDLNYNALALEVSALTSGVQPDSPPINLFGFVPKMEEGINKIIIPFEKIHNIL